MNRSIDALGTTVADKAPNNHNHDDSYPNVICSGRVDGRDNITVGIPNWREYEPWCAFVIGVSWSNASPNISFQLIGNYAGDGSKGVTPANIYYSSSPYQGYINQIYKDALNYKFPNSSGGTVWVIGLPNGR